MPADDPNHGEPARLIDHLERVFPYYLTAESKKKLSDHLGAYPDDKHYYATSWDGPPGPIQGDGWSGFTKLDFETAERRSISGIVVSNSCDIDEENKSLRDRNVVFAPIIPLAAYEARLRRLVDVSAERVESHLDAVRKQNKTEIFYLPESSTTPELIAQFDDIAAQPLGNFAQVDDRRRLFRLNDYGFYVFLMKFSISFNRFGEELERGD